jgi:hypothetical protein
MTAPEDCRYWMRDDDNVHLKRLQQEGIILHKNTDQPKAKVRDIQLRIFIFKDENIIWWYI